ncbi:leucine--tRNA ligase [Pontibacter sp. BT310]|uniref:Leucine--tRNA ligase n=1 Tax=Pontibacter populi TaxID=890055 RepID=A0ABS6XI56_9BACT|nr:MULTISPECIES: leucine--tRNA ligase [Pontibacter]MBJ6120008.1 leucine--tRNA ligase [Pontibacter sp. BT310]MBR0572437.1 leucine--tRNA ligase [Microvirga sp. STS03]MBW3366861.1 leucine--tRNA ligase [Pontibacter populi]
MSEYNFSQIENKWQRYWEENQTFKANETNGKPKYYALDMFPYPSGAGLHVGHPLGYIASDIVSRYKRLKGFNVLHPMGFDSFGLPAEQYAIQTGQHPAITTEQNIARYVEQLKNIGFSFDWEREVRTSDPNYYKWTQWIFKQLFNSYYNYSSDKAESIDKLIAEFEANGNATINAACDEDTPAFTAEEWKSMNEQQQAEMLLKYRLTYVAEAVVNWCPALGTVLANDEVVGGVSERGGYPVERKKMRQWMMRITAYAERLLQGLETIDWPEPVKEMQRNWISKSVGAELDFAIEGDGHIKVFTTRIDTIFGATFVVLAPEHDLVAQITTDAQRAQVEKYVNVAKNRSERERMTDVKTVSGVFTGAYAINPISEERVPIWIADYVLAGYGTGAVMAVPGHDSRDYAFAKHFNLPIREVVAGGNLEVEAYAAKDGKIINSGFLNGLDVKDAIKAGIAKAEELGVGKGRVQYRMRDAVFSRQRYWGEPVPVYFKDGIPQLLTDEELPLELPKIDAYLPTETGEPPLGRAVDWKHENQNEYELSTMPGWAGSSWYWYRYMDPQNNTEFAAKDKIEYWRNVDLYIGGSEHATGHLLYSRFWNKFMFDLGLVVEEEPFKKLINQGMIQGRSNFVYRINGTNKYVSFGLKDQFETTQLHVDVNIVENDILDLEAFKTWRPENADAEFVLEDGKYHVGVEIEKMSKSKYNVVNPDDLVEKMGADTLRMYEMFLGPLEQFKPWNTNGMDGVHKFLKKFWKLFHDNSGNFIVSDDEPTAEELKTLHKTIKKVEEDIERFSFNTSVATFMICVNELTQLKTNKRAILEPLTIVLAPYAPHITEELWQQLGHSESISYATFPQWKEEFLVENTFEYPVSVNGKTRHKLSFATDTPREEIEKAVLADEQVIRFFDGKTPKKVIIVPNKIINVVV